MKIDTVESSRLKEAADRKVVQNSAMLQTVPRVPIAGVKRRWGVRLGGSLQESSPEVSSSGVLSPPPHFHPATPEGGTIRNDDLQLWDLDLHHGLPPHTHIGTTTDPTSPCPTLIEGRNQINIDSI